MVLKTDGEYYVGSRGNIVLPSNIPVRDANHPDFEKKVKLDLLDNIFNYLRENIDHIDLALDKYQVSPDIVTYIGKLGILDYNARKGILDNLQNLEVLSKLYSIKALDTIEEIKRLIKGD